MYKHNDCAVARKPAKWNGLDAFVYILSFIGCCLSGLQQVSAQTTTINTYAGTGSAGYTGDGASATSAKMNKPCGVAVDDTGNVYVADYENKVIRKIDYATGVISTFAGGGSGTIGDGALATNAKLNKPSAVCVTSAGDIYIADTDHHRVRKVDGATGLITTFAGTDSEGYSGDGGAATSAEIKKPRGVAVDSSGNVYFSDSDNHAIRKVTTGGTISTYAGGNGSGSTGDGAAATSAKLNKPHRLAIDASDNLYIADTDNHRIRKVTASTGVITTVAGIGSSGFSGDGAAATLAKLNKPRGITLDSSGNIYIADADNHRVRKVTVSTGNISTIAGSGSKGNGGDGAAATSAQLDHLEGVAVDASGNVYISDKHNHRVRKVDASDGKIYAHAGTGASGYTGDGGAASSARLKNPCSVFRTSAGDLYVADTDNHAIRKVDGATGIITTVAGGVGPYGDGGPATNVAIGKCEGVAMGPDNCLYIACTEKNLVRKVDLSTGYIYAVMGYGDAEIPDEPASDLTLDDPVGIAVDDDGNVYVGDRTNARVVKYTHSTGEYTVFAGITGSEGSSGDGGLATAAKLKKPHGVAVDKYDNVYIADKDNHCVRKVDAATGIISTYAGTGSDGYDAGQDGGAATSAKVGKPRVVQIDRQGNLYIAQTEKHVVRKVDKTGIISTFAGTGSSGSTGDGGDPLLAKFNQVYGIGFKRRKPSYVYIGDKDNHKVRWLDCRVNGIMIIRWTEVRRTGGS